MKVYADDIEVYSDNFESIWMRTLKTDKVWDEHYQFSWAYAEILRDITESQSDLDSVEWEAEQDWTSQHKLLSEYLFWVTLSQCRPNAQ